MQLDRTPRESCRDCIFEVNRCKKKASVWAILKGGDDIFTVTAEFSKHINTENSFSDLEKYKTWVITTRVLLSFDESQETSRPAIITYKFDCALYYG